MSRNFSNFTPPATFRPRDRHLYVCSIKHTLKDTRAKKRYSRKYGKLHNPNNKPFFCYENSDAQQKKIVLHIASKW